MRVLITGHEGYIGAVMAPMFRDEGIDVVGLDSGLFADCNFGSQPSGIPGIRRDLRDVEESDLEGFDAVIHLAAISNDPLGNLNPDCTYAINHRASVRLAELAKKVGIDRFLYSSSCSVYGAASPDDVLDEKATFSPVTPYAESKVRVEADLARMASDSFCPVYLRNATVYGVSPRLRGDLVVNNLVGWAMTTGQVLLKSDGSPWRPLVHVEDVCRAFLAALHAPREVVHNQAFNVGRSGETFRIIEVAQMVADAVDASVVEIADGAGPDPRCYRVNFEKIENTLPGFDPSWTVAKGVVQLREAYKTHGLTRDDLEGSRFLRIARIRQLLDDKRLDENLHFIDFDQQAKGQA